MPSSKIRTGINVVFLIALLNPAFAVESSVTIMPETGTWSWWFKDTKPGDVVLSVLSGLAGASLGIWFKTLIEERSGNRRKKFEEDIQRQNRLILQQIDLLEEFGTNAGAISTSSSKITYYSIYDYGDEIRKRAIQAYVEDWEILDRLRATVRRSRRLCSDEIYNDLLKLYDDILDLDVRVMAITRFSKVINQKLDPEIHNDAALLHEQMHRDLPERVDALLLRMSQDMNLLPAIASKRVD